MRAVSNSTAVRTRAATGCKTSIAYPTSRCSPSQPGIAVRRVNVEPLCVVPRQQRVDGSLLDPVPLLVDRAVVTPT